MFGPRWDMLQWHLQTTLRPLENFTPVIIDDVGSWRRTKRKKNDYLYSLSLSVQLDCSFEATGLITSLTTCFAILDLHKIVWCRYQSMYYSYLTPPRLYLVSSNERCSSKAVKAGSSVFKLSKQLLFRCYYHWKLRLLFGRYMICHHSL